MARADYDHWNEEADIMWWNEEGKHIEEPEYNPDDYLSEISAADAFAEEIAEWTIEQIFKHLCDADYMRRWPLAKTVLQFELEERRIDLTNA